MALGLYMFSKKLLPVLVAASLVAGCAASGPVFTEAPSSPEKALIYIYRQPGFALSGQTAGFTLDGKPITELDAGGYSFFHVAPGHYELRQFWPGAVPLLFDSALEEDVKLPLDVTAGQTRYFRMHVTSSGGTPYNTIQIRWHFAEVPDSIGRQEIVQEKFQPQDKKISVEFRP